MVPNLTGSGSGRQTQRGVGSVLMTFLESVKIGIEFHALTTTTKFKE